MQGSQIANTLGLIIIKNSELPKNPVFGLLAFHQGF